MNLLYKSPHCAPLVAAVARTVRRPLAVACLVGGSLLDPPPIALARESLIADGRPAVGVSQDGTGAARTADEAGRTFKGRPLTIAPQELMTPEEASRTLHTRMQRMRQRAKEAARQAVPAERPRWFEIADPPEGVGAPPAPDAVDGEITIQRMQEEVQ